MKIDTGDHPPIKLRPYRVQLNNRKVIEHAIKEMLDKKKNRTLHRDHNGRFLDKKDGSKRFCIHFRKLNKITKSNSYPSPVIDDILAMLGKAKYFSKLDLRSRYWQIAMVDESKEKTAFTCHLGLYDLIHFRSGSVPPLVCSKS